MKNNQLDPIEIETYESECKWSKIVFVAFLALAGAGFIIGNIFLNNL